MTSVEAIADDIIAREGGYVDDPDDPGGATNWGVTLGTLKRLGLDIDGDGRISKADLRRLGRTQARDIFIEHYFRRPGLARLPEAVQPAVFDMYVNAGDRAVRLLQDLLTAFGFPALADGRIGPRTEAAARAAAAAAPDHLADAYGIARRNFYYGLADRRPALRKFACRRDGGKGGWIVRAETLISPRFRLSDAEHRARVAAWA